MSEKDSPQINQEEQNNRSEVGSDCFEQILEDYVPEESIISITLDKIHKLCEFIQSSILQLNKTLSRLVEHQASEANELERYIELAADCKKKSELPPPPPPPVVKPMLKFWGTTIYFFRLY